MKTNCSTDCVVVFSGHDSCVDALLEVGGLLVSSEVRTSCLP